MTGRLAALAAGVCLWAFVLGAAAQGTPNRNALQAEEEGQQNAQVDQKEEEDNDEYLIENQAGYPRGLDFYTEALEVEKPKLRGFTAMVLGVIMIAIVTFALHADNNAEAGSLPHKASEKIFDTFDAVNELLEENNLPFSANIDIWTFIGGVLLVATGMHEFIQSLLHRRHLRKGIRMDALPPFQGLYLLLAGITSLGGWTLVPHVAFIAHLGVPCVVIGTFLFLYSLIERQMYVRSVKKAQAKLPLPQRLALTPAELS